MHTASRSLGLLAVFALVTGCSISDENDAADGSGGYGTSTSSGSGGGSSSTSSGGGANGGGAGQGGIDLKETPGTIACGDGECSAATDICCDGNCVGSSMECPPTLAADATQDSNSNPVGAVHCDDAADCSGADLCCVDWDAAGPGEVYECAASCQLHEACIPGGECKTPGFVCTVDPTEFTGAKCVASGATVECGATTCQADTPVCCAGNATCGGYDSACNVPIECIDAGDCGTGMKCCGKTAGSTYCAGDCIDDAVLCATPNDCTGGATTCMDAPDPLPPTAQTCQ